jgi:hypothetical protein
LHAIRRPAVSARHGDAIGTDPGTIAAIPHCRGAKRSRRERRKMTAATPVLKICHHDGGTDWLVAACWPDGRTEEISGFKNEAEANEWITARFDEWLRELELIEKGC